MLPADLESRLADVLEDNAAVRAEFLRVRRLLGWDARQHVEPPEVSVAVAITAFGPSDFD